MRRRLARLLAPLLLAVACSSPPTDAGKPATEVKAEPTPSPTPPVEAAPAADPNEACAKIVVVAHKDVADVDPSITRDKAAAQARAGELHARIAGGASIAEVAAAESDDARTKAKRGGMGTFVRDQWPERFTDLKEPVFALKIGERSPPLDTALGFVIAERCPVEKIHTSHILLRYAGAKNADESISRTRDEAKSEAEIIAKAIADGGDFAAIAREQSEDGSAERGGDLGDVGRGMFALAYEEAAFALAPGQVSAPIETDFGFHVIKRMPEGAAPTTP